MKWGRALVVCAAVVLAGCQTMAEIVTEIEASWIGRPVEQLFLQAGPPVASFTLSSGGAIYTWSSGPEIRFAQGTAVGVVVGGQPTVAYTMTPEVRECRARITTDRAGRILSIAYEPDSALAGCTSAFRVPTT